MEKHSFYDEMVKSTMYPVLLHIFWKFLYIDKFQHWFGTLNKKLGVSFKMATKSAIRTICNVYQKWMLSVAIARRDRGVGVM